MGNRIAQFLILSFFAIALLLPTFAGAAVTPKIAAGGSHSVALMADGTVKAWGYNISGQLGTGNTTSSSTPVAVTGLGGTVVAVAAGYSHSVALMADGTVKAWGYNSSGQLGTGNTTSSSTPMAVTGLGGTVVAVAAGYSHSVALMANGTVKAWGYNSSGQLGTGNTTSSSTPVAVTGLGGPVTAVAAGSSYSVALMADGTIKAWGYNGSGQLGNGNTTSSSTPVAVTGLGGTVIAVAAGAGHSMALMADGTVKAWGNNISGQLGNGNTASSSTPVTVTVLGGAVTAVAAGDYHSVALMADGTVKSWGANYQGQLGTGNTDGGSTPVTVTGLGGAVTAVAAGDYHSVALMADGTVKSWGNNGSGQLGDGTTGNRSTPVAVIGLGGTVTAVAAGNSHSVALMADGTVKACGYNGYGQLGDGTNTTSNTPVAVTGLGGTVTDVAAGSSHSVALMANGTVKAWGDNSYGQLGDDNAGYSSNTPVSVIYLGGAVTAVAAGANHSVALMANGTVKAWGINEYGQLGIGIYSSYYSTPMAVTGLGGPVIAVAAGSYHSVALMADGTVKAWGYNGSGQLGTGNTDSSNTPVAVTGLGGTVIAVAAGANHSVALMADGTVKAWGSNGSGQLGDGTTDSSSTPVAVTGLVGTVTAVAAGNSHSMVLMADGTIKAWGNNGSGQLGTGNLTSSNTPVTVTGLGGTVTAVAAGAYHSLSLMSDGTVKAWGDNYSGQLGDGTAFTPRTALINLDNVAPSASTDTPAGTYIGSVRVMLSCSDNFSGCSGIYYTDDDTLPSTTSSLYNEQLIISNSMNLKFMAVDRAGNQSAVQSVSYSLLPSTYPLTIIFYGSGNGSIGYSSGGACTTASGGCSQSIDTNATITLTPSSLSGFFFLGWGGDCSGSGVCTLTMTSAKTAEATFTSCTPLPMGSTNYDLLGAFGSTGTIPLAGSSYDIQTGDLHSFGPAVSAMVQYDITTNISGSGTVDCPTPVEHGFSAACTVTPAQFYRISSVGGCGGSLVGNTYTTGPVTAACIISASFVGDSDNFALTIAGTGSGTVHWDQTPDINCSSGLCSRFLDPSVTATLTGQAAADTNPVVWSGCDSVDGSNQCVVTMTAVKNITATFTKTPVDGACGSAHGQTFASAPTENLCQPDQGIPTTVTGPANGPWSWSCTGLYGGATSTCGALLYDVTPPLTLTSVYKGIYNEAQNITLACSDTGGRGCAGTYYCLGSGCTPATAYNGAIAIAATDTLRFYSRDLAGNSEPVKSFDYIIDPALAYRFERLWPELYPAHEYDEAGNNQFLDPVGVTVDGSGNIFVADAFNNRIQKYDNSGYLTATYMTFYSLSGMAADSDGNLYVAESSNDRILKIDSSGTLLNQLLLPGSGNRNTALAVDGVGNLYVADSAYNLIRKYDSSGNYQAEWGLYGSGNGQFDIPSAVAVDSAGNVYVADLGNHRVQKFDSSGNYLNQWGTLGSGNGEFNHPTAVTVDSAGYVLVVDYDNNRIQKFDSSGNYLTKWGSAGTGVGQFNSPAGLTVDAGGNVYVADTQNHRIQKFNQVSYFVSPVSGPGGSLTPSTAQSVAFSQTASFDITADSGYRLDTINGCDGSLSGNTYTTGPVSADCTVTASFVVFPAAIAVSPAAYDFGDRQIGAGPVTQPVTLSNNGGLPLVVSGITLSGDGTAAYSVTTGSCSSLTPTIAPGASCTVNVTFTPTVQQSWNAILNIASNDTITPTASIPLSGKGVAVLFDLSLTFSGYGSGSVAFSTGGSCTANCSKTLGGGTTVNLTPTADSGSIFTGWTGCDSIAGNLCSVTMSGMKGVTAGFGLSYWDYVPAARLPKTGQTTSYAIGDDGDLEKGIAWPEPRFANPDGSTPVSGTIVLDKLTGLEWPQDGGTPSFAGCTGDTMTWQGALNYVACLNTNNYLNHNDWRLPNVTELASLVNREESYTSGWLIQQGFGNTQPFWYWSSSTYSVSSTHALMVNMYGGGVNYYSKSNSIYVWPVRTGESGNAAIVLPKTGQITSYAAGDDGDLEHGVAWPEPRFTNPDGSTPVSSAIVLDKLTGLERLQNGGTPTVAGCTGGQKTWQEALDYISCLNTNNYLNHNDWRPPNTNELISLINRESANNAETLALNGFSEVQASVYWSSSTSATGTANADLLFFDINGFGDGMVGASSKATGAYVWPVRNGQSGASGTPIISVTPTVHNFPSTATYSSSTTQEVTVSNSGTGSLIAGSITLTGADAGQFSLAPGTCTSLTPTIAAGGSCTVNVTFTPTTVGAKSATLQINSSDPATPTSIVTLSGTAYDPPPFGTVNINGGTAYTTSTSVTLTLAAFDNSGSVTEMRFSNNNSSWSNWELYGTTKDWTLMPLGGDGSKTVYVQFRDGAGNASGSFSDSIVLDSSPPVVTLTAKPAIIYNSASGNVSFSASETATFTCSLDGATATPCVSPWSFTGLADGSHTLTVTATDNAGLSGNTGHTWTIDTTAPTVTFTATPANPSGQPSGTISFSSEAGATFQCKLDSSTWGACSSPVAYGPLSDGNHTLSVRATDTAGNVSVVASHTWSIDTSAPPAVKIGTNSYATLTAALAAATDGATLQLQATIPLETATYSGTATLTLSGGYDSNWNRQTGVFTTVGPVTILSGALTMDGIVIN